MNKRCLLFLSMVWVMLACLAMDARGDDRAKLIEKMIKQLTKDKKADARSEAAKMLGDLKAPEGVPALAAALKDSDDDVRWDASYSLYQISPNAKEAIAALKEALSDSLGNVRLNAAAALSKMDVPDQELVPSVRELLKDRSALLRVKAVDTLLSMDVAMSEVLPVLLDALKDPDPETQERAGKILEDAGELPRTALPALIQAIKHPNPKVRANIVKAISKMGLTAEQAVPALIQALHDSDSYVRVEAANAFGSIGPGAKQAIPELVVLIGKDTDSAARQWAVRSLAKIDPDDPAALPGFLKALKDSDDDVRSEALSGFREMAKMPPAVVSALKETAANDPKESIRFTASNLLKDMGGVKTQAPQAGSAASPRPQIETLLQQLNKELNDTHPRVKDAEEAKQYLHDRDVAFSKDEFWSHLTQGYADVVEAFLKMGMSPNTPPSGGTNANPLQFSTMSCTDPGEAQIALMLLAYGADPDATDEIKRTPILSAVEKCPVIVVKALLMVGAKTDVVTNGGYTVLAAAVMSKRPEVVRMLLNSGYKIKNEPAYLFESAKGNAEIQQLLLKAGIKK